MDRIVRHETPNYVYEPTGLMADSWGKVAHRTPFADFIEEAHLRNRRLVDNDKGRDSLMYIWSLDDPTVLGGRREGSPVHRELCRRLAPVNPHWVTVRCAETAYDRGLIDERELDRVMED